MDLIEALQWIGVIFVGDFLCSVAFYFCFEREKSGKRLPKPLLLRLILKLLE